MGVIAPRLVKSCLPEGLDAWVDRDVKPRRQSRTCLLRCVDDVVIGGERAEDARRIMAVLPTRVARFRLTIHPPQTVLVACRKPDSRQEAAMGDGTVEVLGVTHDWARSRRGSWVITRNTAGTRRWRAQQSRWQWCQTRRGHYPSDGIRGHDRALDALCT